MCDGAEKERRGWRGYSSGELERERERKVARDMDIW